MTQAGVGECMGGMEEAQLVTRPWIRPWARCVVCGYIWHLTDPAVQPRDCPRCKTMRWPGERWRHTRVLPPLTRLPEGTVMVCCSRCGWQWFVRSGVLPLRCARRTCQSFSWHRRRGGQRAVREDLGLGEYAVGGGVG